MKGINAKQREWLFSNAEKAKAEGRSLTSVFKEFADKEGRAFGSVRNFYYKAIANGQAGNLTAKTNKYFSESAENELIARFLQGRAVYGSMRKTAFVLAEGNPILALRYQNKMYNLLKKKRAVVLAEMNNLKSSGEKYYNPFLQCSPDINSRKKALCVEIDGLIKTISQKCKKENEELKSRLKELNDIDSSSTVSDYLEKHNKKNRRAENE